MTATPAAPQGPILHGLPIPAASWAAVRHVASGLANHPTYLYPWEGLEEGLGFAGGSLALVGYGSLLSAASAARTVRPTPGRRRPVVAFGMRRVFDYAMPADRMGASGPPGDSLATAALNVYPRSELTDVFNGVLLEVPRDDIQGLRARELGYDLRPSACLWWDDLEQPPFVAFVLCAPDEPRGGRQYTDRRLSPHREYYQLCRNGAASFSAEFLGFFLNTTYLADQQTTALDWETLQARGAR
jgi:hypothetical protein